MRKKARLSNLEQKSNIFMTITTVATRVGINPKELRRFLKFAVVGVIGAVVDFGSLNIMLAMGIITSTASTISFILAIISNFFWNRFWTYPESRSKAIGRQFGQFFLVNVSALIIRWPIVHFGEKPLVGVIESLGLFTQSVGATVGANLIVAMAVGLVMFWNFFVNRYWTYNDVD